MPIAAGISLNSDGTLSVDTGKDNFWDYPDASLRKAVAGCSPTVAALSKQLAAIHSQLVESGNANAGFFDGSQTGNRIADALSLNGDLFLQSLLFTEAEIIGGATNALKAIGPILQAGKTDAPKAGYATAVLYGDNGQGGGQSILGLPLLNNYYTVFDRSVNQGLGVVSFAKIK